MPVTASVTAIILATSLGLSNGAVTQPQLRSPMIRTLDSGITYRASKRIRATDAYPEITLTCSGRDIRFTLAGLPLARDRNQDIQVTIGDWSRPLYRAQLSQDWGQSVTSPALLAAIRSNAAMTVRIDGRNYRLRPLAREQHNDFARMCAVAVDASVGTHPPQSLIPEPRLRD